MSLLLRIVTLGLCLTPAFVQADVRLEEQSSRPLGTNIDTIEPAAGPAEPTLLDMRADELKGNVFSDTSAKIRDAQDIDNTHISDWKVLSVSDVNAYKTAFSAAKKGHLVPQAGVKNPLLWGEVERQYLLSGKGASFTALNDWLKQYRDHAGAREVYEMALEKRERPRQVCHMESHKEKVTIKPKKKGQKAKTRIKTVKEKVCKMVGSWGPEPVQPLAMELKEAAKDARQAAREAELAKLSDEGRKILGQSWRLRGRGDYDAALAVLLAPRARVEAGTANWQDELVKIASYYHGKRDWYAVTRAAEPAARVSGPDRDDARWLAGYAFYRMGKTDDALEQFRALVAEQPTSSPHYGRGAWWGARAAVDLGKASLAKNLLEAGAQDKLSFYGQLCAAKMKAPLALTWDVPTLSGRDIGLLNKVDGAKRGLALIQLGNTELAQREFKLAESNMPYTATRPLAILAAKLGLPAVALAEGKLLKEKGEILPAALFPLPTWKPAQGYTFDHALMLGIMRQESAFQPQIGSRVGAQGLMQLMPATANYVGRMTGLGRMDRSDLHDPTTNLTLAQAYLKYLSGKLDGNLMLVVAAYNGGIGNVQRWLDKGVTPGRDPVLWLESIPFDETRDYVEKVFANYWIYQQRLGTTPWSLMALADGYWPVQWSRRAETGRGGNG